MKLPTAPTLSDEEREWTGERVEPPVAYMPTVADVIRDPMTDSVPPLPWETPIRDAGVGGSKFVPGGINNCAPFWDEVLLRDHPRRDELLSYVRDGVSAFPFLAPEFRGVSRDEPYRPAAFPGEASPNRIPASHADFVDTEVANLVSRGCLVPWSEVRGPHGPARPRLIHPLAVEKLKPRLVIDCRKLNARCEHRYFRLDTVSKVAAVVEEGAYMGSLDDRSGFHNLRLHPASFPLFGVCYKGVDYVCTTLPFGWNESPFCYHALSEVKAEYMRSRGWPVLAYIDDAFYATLAALFGRSAKTQWLAAAAGIHLGMLVSFMAGYFLSDEKADLRPSRVQRYLGIICDSNTATFRVPEDKLRKLHALIQVVLSDGEVSGRILEKIAGKCVSMSVAIRPASL